MSGKWRYAAVLLAAALMILGTALLVKGRHINETENAAAPEASEAASFEVVDVADRHIRGNIEGREAPEEETPVLLTALPSESLPSEEPSQEEAAPAETSEEVPVGLKAYFRDKLCIDPEKVSLYLNVREAPDEESDILDVLYPDDIVPCTGRTGDWYEIQQNGYTGYVNAFYALYGMEAYEELRDTVAYAVMAKEDGVYMYESAEETGTVILSTRKGDVFRVVDMDATYYTVSVRSPIYETLVIPKNKVVLYYLFLGPGNSNELSDEAEEMFSMLNIEGNLARKETIQREVEYEEEQSLLASSALESSIQESSWLEEYYASSAAETYEETYAAWQPQTAAPTQTAATQPPVTQPPVTSTAPPETQPTTAPTNPGNEEAGQNLTYLGSFRITHYCHCTKCCGVWGSDDPNYTAHGASGLPLVSDYSVAVCVSQIPYGTRLLINGKEYVAADCGVPANCIDIYRRTHAEASAGGMYYADVYIIN